jgi:hypothetical protein
MAGDPHVGVGVCPCYSSERPFSFSVLGCARYSWSPQRRAEQILALLPGPHHGKAHRGTGPIPDTFLSSLRRIRSGVFARPWYAVAARRQGAPRPVMRQKALCAVARRSAISMQNPWEAICVAVNDERWERVAVQRPAALAVVEKGSILMLLWPTAYTHERSSYGWLTRTSSCHSSPFYPTLFSHQ